MDPRVWLDSITFSDGTTINIQKDDVVVFVGPNNAGKSAALRAIRDKLNNPNSPNPVIASISSHSEGSFDHLVSWLGRTTKTSPDLSGNVLYQAWGISFHHSTLSTYWPNENGAIGPLTRLFCHFLTAEERLMDSGPVSSINMINDPPTHPIHYLYRDKPLELEISKHFRQAFEVDLIVHRHAGNTIPLYAGMRPTLEGGQDSASPDYVEQIGKQPKLHEQGDGMRSYAGVLLNAMVGEESILLIDEPETFLHPPQARLLGRSLVLNRRRDRQLFVATHSRDVLQGILDSGSPSVRIVRLRRSGGLQDVNIAKKLDPAEVKKLWKDPLLRYSNILDGLFYEKVIMGEGDSDCRFYAAVLDALCDKPGYDGSRPNVLFTHTSGIGRLPMAIGALRAVDVPVVTVVDFDVIDKEGGLLRKMVCASGGSWRVFRPAWKKVAAVIGSLGPDGRIDGVKSKSSWQKAKEQGKRILPEGEGIASCERLLSLLRGIGIFVVEVGEVESFVDSVESHTPEWVNDVLETKKDLANDPELEEARRFVREIIDWNPSATPKSPIQATKNSPATVRGGEGGVAT